MQCGGLSHSCIPICVLSEDTIPSLIRIICLWSPSHGDYLPSLPFLLYIREEIISHPSHFSYKSVRRYTHPSPFLLYIREEVYPSSPFSYISVSVLYRFLILQSLSLVWI